MDAFDNGGISSWDDWINNLSREQREYEIWRILSFYQKRLKRFEKRKLTDATMSFIGGFAGGMSIVACLRFFA